MAMAKMSRCGDSGGEMGAKYPDSASEIWKGMGYFLSILPGYGRQNSEVELFASKGVQSGCARKNPK